MSYRCTEPFSHTYSLNCNKKLHLGKVNTVKILKINRSSESNKDFRIFFEVMYQSTRSFNIPPPRAFELFKIGLFKFPPLGAKKLFKCPTN